MLLPLESSINFQNFQQQQTVEAYPCGRPTTQIRKKWYTTNYSIESIWLFKTNTPNTWKFKTTGKIFYFACPMSFF